MIKILRHGDLGLVMLANLPADKQVKVASDTKIIMKGGGGNNHSIDKGTLFLCKYGNYDLGFLVAKDTTLLHPDHGLKCGKEVLRKAKLKDGVYGLIRQKEDTHDGMKPVVD